MRPAYDLERPEAQRQQPEEAERGEADNPDAEEKARAAVEVGGGDGNRSHAETPRNADAAAAAPRLRDEVAQRTRPGSAGGSLCLVGTGAIAVRTAKDARFGNGLPDDPFDPDEMAANVGLLVHRRPQWPLGPLVDSPRR